jgi:hypothetical protein
VIVNDGGTDPALILGMGVSSESAGPGDVTMAGEVTVVMMH